MTEIYAKSFYLHNNSEKGAEPLKISKKIKEYH